MGAELNSLSLMDLRELAKQKGLKNTSKLNKEALIEAIMNEYNDVKEEIIDSLAATKSAEDKNLNYIALDKMRTEAGIKFHDTVLEGKYNTYIEQGGTNVSGGQKQRLCIARALLKNPKILILDDSTSAVDTKTDALLRQSMKELAPDTTKLIIAQRISSVKDCDRIIVIEAGEINGIGTHKELLESNAIYKEVYESQMKGDDEQ